ncbi:ribonuclease HII [Thiomicrorhabdus immobilis]|uniref:Ribonuclease HII n=1 Tax=Thiomicrorhabdus immobilis TaxID=2791037 RepID=A0ABN6CWE0_9GAMM|nr:ribonuclease HII [Thiomicrorhabdus immobilis]BCN93430.1 ribonuclease HII [Thiomicrorhabdus immobilis]
MQQNLFENSTNHDFQSLSGTTVGVDEVGRGPLIGDVVACAVILPIGCELPLRDSKKLSEKKRDALAELIKQEAVGYSIAVATPEEIDELNILHATMLAMQRAVSGLVEQGLAISQVYVDGNRCPKIAHSCQSVVKGDDKVMEISAASILAKVYRDRQMLELHEKYPKYGFDQHKGYPTAKHLTALKQFGMIPGYRKSFKPVKELC